MKEKLTNECLNRCWCEFCSKPIGKGEKCLILHKQAQRGTARINICRRCLMKVFLELNVKNKEITLLKKELILEKLNGN